jgi:hypothetical protein
MENLLFAKEMKVLHFPLSLKIMIYKLNTFHYHCECGFWNNEGIVIQDNDKNVCKLRRGKVHM